MDFQKLLNFKNILLGVGIFAVIIALLGFSGKLPIFNNTSTQKLSGTVNVWGTIPAESMSYFVDSFDKEAKTYSMQYTEVPYSQINQKLTTALADGVAPDLIIAPSDIVLSNISRVFPVSVSTMPETNFRNQFIDMSSMLISIPYGYLGLPVSVDPLVLYYNRDILSTNGFTNPPTTWSDLYNYNNKITRLDESGDPTLSTIAFGTYDNVPHITDIIMAMIMQQGQIPASPVTVNDANGSKIAYQILLDNSSSENGISPLNSALSFTKDFADRQKPTYNWNAKSNNALQEFISGNLAFYIGYASESGYIKSANQKLYFDYTYLPQISGSNTTATFGRLYTIFMLRTSPNASTNSLAYQVMVSLATGPFSQNLVGVTGGISALKSNIVASMSSGDQGAEIFGNSALISKNFYDLHRENLEVLMREAIRKVYNGEATTAEASKTLADTLQSVYNGEN